MKFINTLIVVFSYSTTRWLKFWIIWCAAFFVWDVSCAVITATSGIGYTIWHSVNATIMLLLGVLYVFALAEKRERERSE